MDGRVSAMARGRPATIAAVAALALLVAIVPFTVAGLRLDDLGRAVARARDLGIGALRTVLEATVLLAEPDQEGATGPAALLGASRAGPGLASPDRDTRAALDGLPDARKSLSPPVSAAPPAPRPPAAGAVPGRDPDLAPPPRPEPAQEGRAPLVETVFELLETLPQLLPEASPQHASPTESTSPPLLQPVEPVVEPLLEPVTEATSSGLGPVAEATQAVAEPVTDAAQAMLEPATDPASSEQSALEAPDLESGG